MHLYAVTVGTRSAPGSESMDVQLHVLAQSGQDAGIAAARRTKEQMAISTGEAWIEQIARLQAVDILALRDDPNGKESSSDQTNPARCD